MKYEKPDMDVVTLVINDVITLSVDTSGSGQDVNGDNVDGNNGGWNS